jgi:PAS domain S-box-containing protein
MREEIEQIEETKLRETALKNVESILAARQRAERELLATKDALERKTEELSRLAAAIEFSDDAIITKTLEGVIVTWNAGAERMFGYSPEEAMGRPVTLLIPEDHSDEEPAILARLRRGERIEHYETVRQRKDGTLLNISLSVSPIKDASGRILGAVKIARDITRQKRIEVALSASDRRFQLMADSAPVLIWMSDTTKACTWFNRPWLQFTGRDLDQEVGFGWTENVHLEDLDRCIQTYTTHFDAREPFRMEHRLRRQDGAWRWVINTAVPLIEGAAQPFSGYIGSCIDITEFKQAAEEREALLQSERTARTEAERLGRLKDEFLATLSHELRTPLSAIVGWGTLLRRLPPGSPDHTKGLQTIERNARVQAQIINDLLDMSRIISGKVQLDVQWLSLTEVINAAIDAIRPSVDAKRLRLTATLDANITPIRGDPNRLQQVFWNLLTNAVKFTPANGRIHVVLERVNSHVQISVEDSGIGIKPEFIAFAFDRFRQADASTTRNHGGLGLGLSIVRHLVEQHGGTVRVKSRGESQGTTFIVALPVSVIRREETGRYARADFTDVDPFSLQLPNLRGITALVVDDELDSRTLVGRLIEESGGRAILAGGAGEAVDVLSRERVDVLVSDVGMPDRDGYTLIREVRKANLLGLGRIPAIALTAYARTEDRQRALLAGYQMHLAKPIEPRELIAGIASLVNLPTGGH